MPVPIIGQVVTVTITTQITPIIGTAAELVRVVSPITLCSPVIPSIAPQPTVETAISPPVTQIERTRRRRVTLGPLKTEQDVIKAIMELEAELNRIRVETS